MKRLKWVALSFAFFILALVISMFNNQANSNIAGAPPSHTGSPGDAGSTCATAIGCHSGPPVPVDSGVITSNVPVTGYIPGFTYTITAHFVRPGHGRFGFEVSPQDPVGNFLGSLVVTVPTETQITGTGYITHTTGGIVGSGQRTWTFNWVAPPAGTGNVTFYGCFNATNSSNTSLGDSIFKSTYVVTEDPHTGIAERTALDGNISLYPNPAVESITVNYNLNREEKIRLSLISLEGREVSVLNAVARPAGQHTEKFMLPADIASGVYTLQFFAGNSLQSRKIVVK